MANLTIGIDVGGTNTDVVLMNGDQILTSAKSGTSRNVTDGIKSAVASALLQMKKTNPDFSPHDIHAVKLGTTHLLNATLRHQLQKVGIIRLAAPATTALLPCDGWPNQLTHAVIAGKPYVIAGGKEYDGRLIAELDKDALRTIALDLQKKNIRAAAVISVFGFGYHDQENEAAQILKQHYPELSISLSHNFGELGLLERENATILNAALEPTYHSVCNGLTSALSELNLTNANIYMSLNDGTVAAIDQQHSSAKPIFTLNAGPTNSMRGAAIIAKQYGLENAIALDVGGTSTDAGLIQNGAPIEEKTLSEISGVRLCLATMRTESIGLGGGSKITRNADGTFEIGPDSIANRLMTECISCGGPVFTPTDIAVLKNRISFKRTSSPVMTPIDPEMLEQADTALHMKCAALVYKVMSCIQKKPDTLLLIGGGSRLFDIEKLETILQDHFRLKLKIIVDAHAHVANALGAACGEIGARHTQLFDCDTITRDEAIQQVLEEAKCKARALGAIDPIAVRSINPSEIRYVHGTPTMITVSVSGKIGYNIHKKTTSQNLQPTTNCHTTITPEENQISLSLPLSSDKQSAFEDIEARSVGSSFLASGGGGDTRFVKTILQSCIREGLTFQIIPLEEIEEDALIVAVGFMGSPTVLEEKLLTADELIKIVKQIEIKLGRKINAIAPYEIGGANGLLALVAAAKLGIPLVDGDQMGRAFPGIHHTIASIDRAAINYNAMLVNSSGSFYIEAKDPNEMEKLCRQKTVEMGGASAMAYLPMTGKAFKKSCIPHSLSIAKKMGEAFLNSQHPLDAMNQVLADTDYKEMKEVFSGHIEKIVRKEEGGFSVGGLEIKNANGDVAELVFQNENLLIRKKLPNGFYLNLVIVPNLITIVDRDNLLPISCGQLRYGQEIRVITMTAPKQLQTEAALAVIGPEAYQIDKLLQLLKGKTQTVFFKEKEHSRQQSTENMHSPSLTSLECSS